MDKTRINWIMRIKAEADFVCYEFSVIIMSEIINKGNYYVCEKTVVFGNYFWYVLFVVGKGWFGADL